jgi:hypothetical protein
VTNALRRVGVSVSIVAGMALAPGLAAASAASFAPAPGVYTADTTNLRLTGPGTDIAGVDEGGVAVFSFDSVNIAAGVEIDAEGDRPLEINAAGVFMLAGLIEAGGFSPETEERDPAPGGPGGGAGGAGGGQSGSGPGGGGHGAETDDGGGGGGFGGAGAAGGSSAAGGGTGGSAYGDLNAALQGGSGGGGGTTATAEETSGGGGGGAVALSASSLTIAGSGEVRADGGDGNGAGNGASGGGSGGGIVLNATILDVSGSLSADGGEGGTGGCCGDGGGGGGGRIAYRYVILVNAGSASVDGGTSGTSGPYGPGEPSPQAAGATGVITNGSAVAATTSSATLVSPRSAVLNGAVNPHGNPTTYHFQLGPSTAYGVNVPVPSGLVGSDFVDHSLAAAVGGLAPNVVYHYRIDATDRLGIATYGADTTFDTFAGASIRGSRVEVRKGVAYLKLRSGIPSKGKLKLSAAIAAKKGKASASKKRRRKVTLGRARFSLAAAKAKTVKVRLTRGARKLLEGKSKLKSLASAAATDAYGASVTTTNKVTLKPVKGKQKR